jgi:hypothetical protein
MNRYAVCCRVVDTEEWGYFVVRPDGTWYVDRERSRATWLSRTQALSVRDGMRRRGDLLAESRLLKVAGEGGRNAYKHV